MIAGEFELVARHLSALGAPRADVILGVGDDAALLAPSSQAELRCACVCTDLTDRSERQLTRAIEAVFRDLCARLQDDGFTPAWATLALTLARSDQMLVRAVATAVHEACVTRGIAVIGGDTTAGPNSLTIFLTGMRASAR